MNRISNFFRHIYDFFFDWASIQERGLKADYELLKQEFLAKNYGNLEEEKPNILAFKDLRDNLSSYDRLCLNVINLLHPKNNDSKKFTTEGKFKLLNLARRVEILEYGKYKCDTRIKQMLAETSKLDTWRKEAIIQLLSKYKDIPTEDSSREPVQTTLYEAAYIRDVYFDNLYFKSKIAKRTILFLNWVLLVLLVTILINAAYVQYVMKPPYIFLLGPFSDLWLVVLFGLLGAAFSTLLNLYKGNKLKNNIIKQIDADSLTVARLVIGASAGLIMFLILNSGLIKINGFNDSPGNTGKGAMALNLPMLSLIFIAGFTERFVLNFIDKLSTQAAKPEDADKKEDEKLTEDLTKTSVQGRANGTQKKEDAAEAIKKMATELAQETQNEIKTTDLKGVQ